MDGPQWRWAESILRVACQIARREPMVTQYEGVLQGILCDSLCGMGLTVSRERVQPHQPPNAQEMYLMRHHRGSIELTRNIGNHHAWWAERYTPRSDLQFGINNVAADDLYMRLELKVGSVFPKSSHQDVAREHPGAWYHDLENLSRPHAHQRPILNPDGPKADAFLIVCDVGVYLTLTGHQVRRSPPAGGGRPSARGDFSPILPPLADVLANRGQRTEAIGVYPRTGVQFQSVVRMVRPRVRHPRIWYRFNEDDDYLGPDDAGSFGKNSFT